MKISDCKKAYEKDGKYRYVVASVRYNAPMWLCPTYESAKEAFEHCWKYSVQTCKIVDLMHLEENENEENSNIV